MRSKDMEGHKYSKRMNMSNDDTEICHRKHTVSNPFLFLALHKLHNLPYKKRFSQQHTFYFFLNPNLPLNGFHKHFSARF